MDKFKALHISKLFAQLAYEFEQLAEQGTLPKREPRNNGGQTKGEKPPYWSSEFKGKSYIFARVGETYKQEDLNALGMKQSEKNPKIFSLGYTEMLKKELEELWVSRSQS